MAIYLDDFTSGTLVYGNICYRASRATLLGGGRDNTFENNIFIECDPSVHVDARGLGWAKYYFENNNRFLDLMEAVNYKEPPYSEKYPNFLLFRTTTLLSLKATELFAIFPVAEGGWTFMTGLIFQLLRSRTT